MFSGCFRFLRGCFRFRSLQALCDLIDQQSDHADPVFQLYISVITVRGRHWPSRKEIPFVRCMDKMSPVTLHIMCLPPLDLLQNALCILPGEWFQRKKPLPEPGQPYRNHRHTAQMRDILLHLLQRIFQFLPVIDPFAQNDLSVHFDSGFTEPLNLRKNIAGKTVAQHLAAQLRIHCLEGYVDRLHPVTNDPVDIVITHIGKCHIIALQKGKTRIVVLKIQGIAHSLRHLINKTEDTGIAAGPVFIQERILEFNSEILLEFLLDLQLPFLTGGLADHDLQVFLIGQIPVIKDILHRLSADGNQHITRLDFELPGDTPGKNPLDDVLC